MSGQSHDGEILLYIMRHGEAEAPRFDDRSRQLTAAGREQVTHAAQWLKQHFCESARIDLALVSPYRRTRQTFDSLSLDIQFDKMEVLEDITPDGDPNHVSDYLQALLSTHQTRKRPIQQVILVSHMPLVSYLVDTLCHSYTTSLFATASVAVVAYSPERGEGRLLTHYQG
ncbi:phosphohistidine phosphatase SixA [Alteromonas sp. CYL-A6]|uniref:phosphohistidine phosphatase SixA n=1 Tax=Alteromonas nitratireducens TaxID=3390813 RepID=UPI0034AB0543